MLNSVVCKELTEKVSFRQKLKGDERVVMQISGGRLIQAKEKTN